MRPLQTQYQSLVSDDAETAHGSVHFSHKASEESGPRWSHVKDLDDFFRRIYEYHQQGGFTVILVSKLLVFVIFLLIVWCLLTFPFCIEFNFDWPSSKLYNRTNLTFSDLFYSIGECHEHNMPYGISSLIVFCVLCSLVLFVIVGVDIMKYREIKTFYEGSMQIPKNDMQNITWHEVQCKLREVQHEQLMCVISTDLTELDISNRILRHKNFMVAMVNKNILPIKYDLGPFGEWVYYTPMLDEAIEFILFKCPLLAPFINGKLREEYKKREDRVQCAEQLSRLITIIGVLSLVLGPLYFLYQLLLFLLSYSGVFRYEPAFLVNRRWSLYARLYLRHFNELDHELNARLCRAYKPSKDYMKSFSTPLANTTFSFSAKIFGFLSVFLFVWGMFKEKLFQLSYVVLFVTMTAAAFTCFSSCVPDENEIFFPQQLMEQIVADIHYAPDNFRTKAHTSAVRDSFSQFFQYKIVGMLEALFSPLIVPVVLLCRLRHRALDIVDFLRNFTVHVDGVGDVCSFALMDVSKHGNQQWLGKDLTTANPHTQAENGKTELSLIHFSLMNPNWEPPPASNTFIQSFRQHVAGAKDKYPGIQENAFYNSLNSLSSMGSKYASLVNSVHHSMHQREPSSLSSQFVSSAPSRRAVMKHAKNAEGPPYLAQNGILTSVAANEFEAQPNLNPIDVRAADMSMSALFLHEVHDRQVECSRSLGEPSGHVQPQETSGEEDDPISHRTGYIH